MSLQYTTQDIHTPHRNLKTNHHHGKHLSHMLCKLMDLGHCIHRICCHNYHCTRILVRNYLGDMCKCAGIGQRTRYMRNTRCQRVLSRRRTGDHKGQRTSHNHRLANTNHKYSHHDYSRSTSLSPDHNQRDEHADGMMYTGYSKVLSRSSPPRNYIWDHTRIQRLRTQSSHDLSSLVGTRKILQSFGMHYLHSYCTNSLRDRNNLHKSAHMYRRNHKMDQSILPYTYSFYGNLRELCKQYNRFPKVQYIQCIERLSLQHIDCSRSLSNLSYKCIGFGC